jgi:pimeloyl-ACP methyl ester carboxylesterase
LCTSTDGPASGAESRETRLALTDPARLLPLGVPQLIVMGELDAIVPPEHGMWWRRRAEARGDVVELAVIPGAGHFELVAPWSPPWDSVESRVRSFLSRFVEGG